nr:MAG TPA: hypothetical protein [Caudoviricetes sp.]
MTSALIKLLKKRMHQKLNTQLQRQGCTEQ